MMNMNPDKNISVTKHKIQIYLKFNSQTKNTRLYLCPYSEKRFSLSPRR